MSANKWNEPTTLHKFFVAYKNGKAVHRFGYSSEEKAYDFAEANGCTLNESFFPGYMVRPGCNWEEAIPVYENFLISFENETVKF